MGYEALRFSPQGVQLDTEKAFFEFDERCHLQLIGELAASTGEFPLLSRIQDPYGDANFHATEIAKLQSEALRLARKTAIATLRTELIRFSETLNGLVGSNANLCFFGD